MVNTLKESNNSKAMSDVESLFLKKVRATMWQGIVSLIGIVILAGVPFYFNTKSKLESQSEAITEIKQTKAEKAVYEISVTQIKDELKEINRKLEKIQDSKNN